MMPKDINDIIAILWSMDEDERRRAFAEIRGQFCVECGMAGPTRDCYCGW